MAKATIARPEKRVDSVIVSSMPGMDSTVSVRTKYGQIDTIATPWGARGRAASRGETVEGFLADPVDEVVEVAHGAGRADVDHQAAPGGDHRAGRVMGAGVRRSGAHVDERVPVGDGCLPEGHPGVHVRRGPEGVVHQHVETAVLVEHAGEEGVDVVVVRVIASHRDRAATERRDLLDRGLEAAPAG